MRDHRHLRRSLLITVVAALSLLTGPGAALAGPDGEPTSAGKGDAASAGKGDATSAGKAVERAEAVLEDATVLARNAARQLEAATAALPAAQAKVATSRGLVAAARAQANTARRMSVAARAKYNLNAGRFELAQHRVAVARDRVDEIAAASYMGSGFTRVNVLVAATGPADIMDRLGLVDQVMQKQNADVDTLTAARRNARTEQDRAGLAKRAAEDAERDATAKLAAAQSAEHAAERARAAVVQLTQSRARALAVAKSQRTAVLARYQQAKDEEARIRTALGAYAAKGGSTGGPYVGGPLLMPVQGWKSSDFGERYDPYYRVWQLHAGTDFAAGGGTPIHAAAAGRVLRAGWYGGYGNYTCISHGEFDGRDFSTCYGHQSAIGVYVGEYVTRGEVIGRVGTTGASTGYHLHFETRFDGVPTNPLPYLPSCLC